MREKEEQVGCLQCQKDPSKRIELAQVRGLCWFHYNQSSHRVRQGKTTWEQLIEEGKALPSKAKVRLL